MLKNKGMEENKKMELICDHRSAPCEKQCSIIRVVLSTVVQGCRVVIGICSMIISFAKADIDITSYPIDTAESIVVLKPTVNNYTFLAGKESNGKGKVLGDKEVVLPEAYAYVMPDNMMPQSKYGGFLGKLSFALDKPATQATNGVYAHGNQVLIYNRQLTPIELGEGVPWDGTGVK